MAPRFTPTGTGDASSGASRVLWVGRIFILSLSLVLIALLFRVGQIQSNPDPGIAQRVGSQTSERTLLARRGPIVDRQGRTLAASRVAHRLFVDPQLVENRGTFSEHVAHQLGYNPVEIEKQLAAKPRSRYIIIDQRLSDERLEQLADLRIPGLAVEPYVVRDYPMRDLAGHMIGFVGVDGDGLAGLEAMYNHRLAPTTGSLRYTRDTRRQPLWAHADAYQPQQPGRALRTSIDANIQKLAEYHLAKTVNHYGALHGQIIVMDPATGEILALANHPPFDPNHFRTSTHQQRRNRAVTDVFEPGSIFKPFIWSALVERGTVDPEEMFDVTEAGVAYFGRRRLRDVRGHGEIDWNTVLINSSNIGMAQGAERVSRSDLHDMLTQFGFGQRTGSSLPGEEPGIVNPLASWTSYSQSSIPMGQEIGVTGLQLVRALAAIANDGQMPTPTILPVDAGWASRDNPHTDALHPAVARYTRHVLRRAVTEGTGRQAQSQLYSIWGKTGTAQRPDLESGGYHANQYVASFIAGAPEDRPAVVVGCFIHRPDPARGYYGGIVAAPPVMELIDQILPYMGVQPDLDGGGNALSTRSR